MLENLIQLQSISGMELKVHPLGARIVSLKIPIVGNEKLEVHEFYEDLDSYRLNRKFSGAIIGPYANRISEGKFSINRKTYKLEQNDGENTLHSGPEGLHLQIWEAKQLSEYQIVFEMYRPHLSDGFPGNRNFRVSYALVEDDLVIDFEAETDVDTPINMTSHGYFNLDKSPNLDNHQFFISKKNVVELNENKIPTGKLLNADPFFELGSFQSLNGRIFDHHFNFKNPSVSELCAAAYCPTTDLTMEVFTDQPGMQFYTGNGKYFCFETQHPPNSINQSSFGNTILAGGQVYKQRCVYRFDY